jgi:hypothetical protein
MDGVDFGVDCKQHIQHGSFFLNLG